MAIIGALGIMVLAAIVLAVAGVTAWSGWRAYRDELIPGFKRHAPGPRSLSLLVLGVALPLVAIVAFTIYTTLALLQVAVAALR